jgi:hypothetical protein
MIIGDFTNRARVFGHEKTETPATFTPSWGFLLITVLSSARCFYFTRSIFFVMVKTPPEL